MAKWGQKEKHFRILQLFKKQTFCTITNIVCAHLNLVCVAPYLPEAASGLARSLIFPPLWIAVNALVQSLHRLHFPLHHIALPQSQGKALKD